MSHGAEAEVVRHLPERLAAGVGAAIVAYARLEHTLTLAVAFLLQLNKAEARLALRIGRPEDALATAVTLFALKGIDAQIDVNKARRVLAAAKTERDALAHGIWLKLAGTGGAPDAYFLQISRGYWGESSDDGFRVRRDIFPQSKPFDDNSAKAALAAIEEAQALVDQLGQRVDAALEQHPERFGRPAPILDPLARQASKRNKPPRST